MDDCGHGFFTDQESRDCEPCHAACRTCGGPLYDDCDSCGEGSQLKDGECIDGRQFVVCPEKHFANSTSDAPSVLRSMCFERVSPNVSELCSNAQTWTSYALLDSILIRLFLLAV